MKSCEVSKRYVGLCVIWFVKNGCSFWESMFAVQRMDSHRWAGSYPSVSQFVIYSTYLHTPLRMGHLTEPTLMLRPCSQLPFFINYTHLFSCSHRKLILHTQPIHKYFCGYTWPFCNHIYLWHEWWRIQVILCWFLQACSDMSIPWLISVLILSKISVF